MYLVFEICMLTVTLLSITTLPCPTLLVLDISRNQWLRPCAGEPYPVMKGTVEPCLKTTLKRRQPCYKDHFRCSPGPCALVEFSWSPHGFVSPLPAVVINGHSLTWPLPWISPGVDCPLSWVRLASSLSWICHLLINPPSIIWLVGALFCQQFLQLQIELTVMVTAYLFPWLNPANFDRWTVSVALVGPEIC